MRNVHALAIDGTFDDCQAIVKALFNDHAFRERVKLSGVNSINWARIVAQAVYYFTAAVALGAPHRPSRFAVPTGNFGDIFAGYVAQAHGPADRAAGHRHQRQRHPRPHARHAAATSARTWCATASPSMDIQVSSNFERLLFEAYGRDAAAVRARCWTRRRRSASSSASRRSRRIRADFEAGRADEDETRATIRDVHRSSGYCSDPHSAVGLAVARKRRAIRPCRSSCSSPRIRRNSPTRSRPPPASGRSCRPARRSHDAAGARDRAAGGQGEDREVCIAGRRVAAQRGDRHERRAHASLPSGITIVTDPMPHLETAALGIWVGAGWRHETPAEHGISHLLEHMAFKGTKRRSARQIAEEIEAVGGDLNAATSNEMTGYYARVLGRRVGSRSTFSTDILTEPAFDQDELKREQGVIVQEIGAGRHARRPGVRLSSRRARFPGSRSAARSSARRRACARRRRRGCATTSRATTAPNA